MADKITGRRKAAMLLMAMGKEASVKVFKNLSDDEINELSLEIANIGTVTPRDKDQIIEEFYHISRAQSYISKGGVKYASEVLEQALGKTRADKIIQGLSAALQANPFDFVKGANPENVVRFIQGEQPQTIALILAHLEPQKAGLILSRLSENLRPEVARRIAMMDETPPDIVERVERILEDKLSSVITQKFHSTGGVKALVDVINRVDRVTEKSIMDYLSETDAALSDEVKKLMFVFEDILTLDDKSIQRILRDIDTKDLAMALKTSSEELKSKIFKNMSDRSVETLKEEMEFMGPVRIRQVEETQQKIVYVIRSLEEKEEIVISRGGEEESFV